MLKAGWVTTYEQAGAEYGQWGKDEFLRIEAEAKAAQRGMWKFGVSSETPAEYKRRYAKSETASGMAKTAAQDKAQKLEGSSRGWFSRLWGSK